MAASRTFDYDEARRLRAEGWSYPGIGALLGVSATAVARACDDRQRARMNRAATEWTRENRKPCLGGCGALVWMHATGRSGYCRACYAVLVAAPNVRDSELRCTRCGEWKPDKDFAPGSAGRPARARRGRRPHCRACESAARQANREANRERERAWDRERKRRRARVA